MNPVYFISIFHLPCWWNQKDGSAGKVLWKLSPGLQKSHTWIPLYDLTCRKRLSIGAFTKPFLHFHSVRTPIDQATRFKQFDNCTFSSAAATLKLICCTEAPSQGFLWFFIALIYLSFFYCFNFLSSAPGGEIWCVHLFLPTQRRLGTQGQICTSILFISM